MRLNKLIATLSLALTALLALPSIAAAQDAKPSFDGTWSLSTKGARGQIDRKIEPVVQEHFSFVTRGFARDKLKEKTKPYTKLTFKTGGSITITDSRGTASTPNAQGKKTTIKRGGESYGVEQYQKGDTIVQIWHADGGKRTNTYKLSADGKTMTMSVILWSDKFTGGKPKDLRYSLTYTKN